MKAAKGWDEGEEGNLLEKVSLFPLEFPHHPCQNFLSRSMGLCRCAAGSRPAPVPRCCGGTVRMEVRVLPASSCPGGASSVSRQDSGKRFLKLHGQQRRKGPGSRRRQARTSFFSCRSVTDISPAQPTGWTNPALWSATNQENFCFLRAGSCGWRRCPLGAKGRDGQIFAQRRQESDGWFRERREKMARRGESPGCQDGKGRQWYPRTGRNAAPGRSAEGPAALGLHRKAPCRKEKVRPCVRFRSHTEHRHVPGRRACLLLTIQDRTLLQKVLP